MMVERGTLLNNRYRIVEILGQGGMGSVYRAIDENLGVQVAVKENLFTTEEYARQFRTEAIILATLRHPNLPRVTDHFVIEGQGQYLVMDYIEGEDLRERIDRQGPLTDAEAVALGVAICDALSYLHARQPQVVHRDIKPGNVKITPNGNVLLVDFGLAKVLSGTHVTTTGARAMTPGYSPAEQYGTARTDHRSDVYSLGATLYMALSGALPEDALARAMGQEVLTPLTKHNPGVSKKLAMVIEKAMELRPDDRYQSAEDMKNALIKARVNTRSQRTQEYTLSPPPGEPGGGRGVPVNRSVVGGLPASMSPPGNALLPADRDLGSISRQIPLPRKSSPRRSCLLLGFLLSLLVAMSAMGAYYFRPDLVYQAYRNFPALIPVLPVSGAGSTSTPATAVTPSGRVPPTSTMGQTYTPTETEATIAALATVSTPTVTTVLPSSTPTHTPTPRPTPLGGGKGQIAYASDVTGLPQIWLMNADGTGQRQITDMPEGACQPAWAPDGSRLAFISPCAGNQEIYPGAGIFVINVDGTGLTPITMAPGGDFDPAWSPDGSQIAFTSLRDFNRAQIYTYDFNENIAQSVSKNTVRDNQPAWSPDGARMAFVTTRRGPSQIWIMDADGANAYLLSRSGSLKDTHPVWSPDGTIVLFTQNEVLGGVPRLIVMRVESGNLVENRLVRQVIPMREASYSPDGAWIAYESWPDGSNHDIYIMTANGLAQQRLTTDESFEFDPIWRP